MVLGAGFRVTGAGCGVRGVRCRVQGAGCRVQGARCRVQGSGCGGQDSGYRVQGYGCRGFRVQGTWCVVSTRQGVCGSSCADTESCLHAGKVLIIHNDNDDDNNDNAYND